MGCKYTETYCRAGKWPFNLVLTWQVNSPDQVSNICHKNIWLWIQTQQTHHTYPGIRILSDCGGFLALMSGFITALEYVCCPYKPSILILLNTKSKETNYPYCCVEGLHTKKRHRESNELIAIISYKWGFSSPQEISLLRDLPEKMCVYLYWQPGRSQFSCTNKVVFRHFRSRINVIYYLVSKASLNISSVFISRDSTTKAFYLCVILHWMGLVVLLLHIL